jgi:D-alanine-D-alanine ligase
MRVAVLHQAPFAGAGPDEADVLVQVECVCDALAELGHEPLRLALDLDLERGRAELAALRADLAFNLVESLGGKGALLHLAPALLRSMALPFTGAGAEALLVSTDKLAARRRLAAAGLPVPAGFVHQRAEGSCALHRRAGAPAGRYVLKPVCEDASVGLDDASVVDVSGARELAARLHARERELGLELFAEEWIEGRELNLSLLAKPGGVEVLPAAEILFQDFPPGKPRMVGYAAKWRPESFEYRHTPRRFDLPASDAALVRELGWLARRAWDEIGLAGWGRVDLRVDSRGRPWILEVNANPCLSPDAGFQAALARAGIGFAHAVERIVASALVESR